MQLLSKPLYNRGKNVILFDIDYTLFDTALFKKTNLQKYSLYHEELEVLNKISKKAILGIFSEGDKNLQKSKLKETKIYDLFHQEHVHIEPQKEKIIKEIGEKYKNIALSIVDDKLPVLSLLKKQNPYIFTVWIKRGVYALNQPPLPDFSPDAVIGNLKELLPLMNKKYGFSIYSH